MTKDNYSDVVVHKPWGSEYLMFENADVALWHLRIKAGQKTSLHCHPRKKTALVLVTGSATISFLNNKTLLRAPANTMLRPGLFHSTSADQGTDIDVIELESPVDKTNIVRLEDAYGRENQPYESRKMSTPIDETCLQLPTRFPDGLNEFSFCGLKLVLFRFSDIRNEASLWDEQDIVVILEGGLRSEEGEPILVAGDAVSVATVNRLASAFGSPDGIAGMWIRKGANKIAEGER